jgi:hypothetical protein
MIALIVLTDGRDDCLVRCAQAAENLRGPISEVYVFDDTGDDAYRETLRERWPLYRHRGVGPRRGFSGAIRHAWDVLHTESEADWIFHLEQDFLINRPVDLNAMINVMEANPHLAQMALRRQAWSSKERAYGGIVEQDPGAYEDHYDQVSGQSWLEHRKFFTTNPSLYHHSLTDLGWPEGTASEGRFGIRLFQHGAGDVIGDQVRCGYWGTRKSDPWVEHIGITRVGTGY